ncbi:GPW/gp25 family protein [Ignatzschineria rhizosphaerae]|uniref:GPW/gp25 family protein n=1 Tax=Ignatzschineria rhizosphaerae TaxID=2923279 RepID=A0ABY3X169_9GAMM|nr:GPW/gp25 family protein [Ignatzschineria rhizosphaerae]UNM95511.1 GPW/gp25 family protein [Ignatzschineria rhizosphaerae]UNM96073.1 GPW/gp25 family protein [Ignatzschineria rhizosphaerae]
MIDRNTGLPISENEHIIQSLLDIATTAIGTRVMRRDYGTILVPKIDAPMNAEYRMLLMSSLMMAFTQYEPRIEIRRINLKIDMPGHPKIEIEAVKKETNDTFTFEREIK